MRQFGTAQADFNPRPAAHRKGEPRVRLRCPAMGARGHRNRSGGGFVCIFRGVLRAR